MSDYQISKNKYGYSEVVNKPTEKELINYYSEKYYQESKGDYTAGGTYSSEEVRYFLNKIEQKYHAAITVSERLGSQKGKFLDVGAGEGWALKYFNAKGWICTGLDFSEFGVLSCNPELKDKLIIGDVYQNLNQMFDNNEKFDLILLDNVLEHVIDPFELLKKLKKIMAEDGVLIIEVPNDYSVLQNKVYSEGLVSREYWVALPDHLSYFNKEGLTALAHASEWEVRMVFTAFPIDMNIFNINTNYIENPDVGKSCHLARVEIENMLNDISIDKVLKMYEAMADLGLGREIIALLTTGSFK